MSAPASIPPTDFTLPPWALQAVMALLLFALGWVLNTRRAVLEKIIATQEEMLRGFQALQTQQALNEQNLGVLKDLLNRHDALLTRVVDDMTARTERVQTLSTQAAMLSQQLDQLRDLVVELRRDKQSGR